MNSESGKGLAIMANSDNGLAVADVVLRRVAKEYAWNYKFGGQPPALMIIAKVRGVEAALDRYAELKKAGELQGGAAEGALNRLGYSLLYSEHEQDAITVFQRNVQETPASSNVYDSLGEAYMKVGEKNLAIANYEKSLQLDPKNQNAVEQLKKLRNAK
jgi:predicted Zn-dependent protease